MTQISHKLSLPAPIFLDIWRVGGQPNVNHRESTYPQIQFQPGDAADHRRRRLLPNGWPWSDLEAVGQSVGAEFRRALHGLIKIPGMPGLVRVQDVGQQLLVVPTNVQGDRSLHLGYEDDGYQDNGY